MKLTNIGFVPSGGIGTTLELWRGASHFVRAIAKDTGHSTYEIATSIRLFTTMPNMARILMHHDVPIIRAAALARLRACRRDVAIVLDEYKLKELQYAQLLREGSVVDHAKFFAYDWLDFDEMLRFLLSLQPALFRSSTYRARKLDELLQIPRMCPFTDEDMGFPINAVHRYDPFWGPIILRVRIALMSCYSPSDTVAAVVYASLPYVVYIAGQAKSHKKTGIDFAAFHNLLQQWNVEASSFF